MQAAREVVDRDVRAHRVDDSRWRCDVGLNHRVIRHLASGGEANVYLAEHIRLGTYAAVKFTETRTTWLQYEAYLLGRVRHPNVARALEYGRMVDGSEYLLLEYARGIDLAEWITRAPGVLSRPRALQMLSQVADAVDHIHDCGIVHGDIKPGNVMFDPNRSAPSRQHAQTHHDAHHVADTVKLIDFGLAFDVKHGNQRVAGTGTPGYMAPEQERGEACGPAIDRFAFALLAYEVLSGAALQPQMSQVSYEVTVQPEQPSTTYVRPQLPGLNPEMAAVFEKALHEDPAQRYASAHEFVAQLMELNRLGVLHAPSRLVAPASDSEMPSGMPSERSSDIDTRDSEVPSVTAAGPVVAAPRPRPRPAQFL